MDVEKNLFRLQHVVECVEKIEIITKDLSYGDYLEDWIKQDAIFRNIEIIGEAIANVEDELKQKYPEVAWFRQKECEIFLFTNISKWTTMLFGIHIIMIYHN